MTAPDPKRLRRKRDAAAGILQRFDAELPPILVQRPRQATLSIDLGHYFAVTVTAVGGEGISVGASIVADTTWDMALSCPACTAVTA